MLKSASYMIMSMNMLWFDGYNKYDKYNEVGYVKHITSFVVYICWFTNTTVVSYVSGSLRSERALYRCHEDMTGKRSKSVTG